MTNKKEDNLIVTNRKARRDYIITETFEAGIMLTGTEIKSLRAKKASLSDSFARVVKGEIFLYNFHIGAYEFGNIHNVDPLRERKLLLHKKQIQKIFEKNQTKGMAIVPLKVYLKRGLAKVEIALGQGKKLYDKRETIKKRQAKREIDREMRNKK
ncbi:MAG: SsrA-binding protein SmpB [Candidatus Omnitrophica bacterium]|nr:SsrA-binding protein SmpB [Candidatus Omnitrophota bacterium]